MTMLSAHTRRTLPFRGAANRGAFMAAVRGRSRRASQPVVCQAVRFPASLPLLPFTPKEVFPPGSCKVLRLYDSSSYMLLLEELLSSPHQMMIHSAVEPSSVVDAKTRLGGYEAGGFVFHLSTIIKVIDVKQTDSGVLLRVQSEGRVAVKSLAQTQPYFRAVVVPVTDNVDLDRLQAPMWREVCGSVERLRGLMKDVQNLTTKFTGPETSNLQRAMGWVDNPHPLVFSSSSLLLNSRTAAGSSRDGGSPATSYGSGSYDADDFQPSKILANQIQPDVDPMFLKSGSVSGSIPETECDAQYAAAAATGGADAAAVAGSSSGRGGAASGLSLPTSLPGAAAGSAGGSGSSGGGGSGGGGSSSSSSSGFAAAAVLGDGASLGGGVIRSRPSLLDLERACRLSLAAIQIMPRTNEEERAALRRYQVQAMETQDVLERLHLAQRVMGEARGILSAKSALLTLSAPAV